MSQPSGPIVQQHNKHMVAVGRGRWCGTSAASAGSLLSRRARAATAAAAHVQRVMWQYGPLSARK